METVRLGSGSVSKVLPECTEKCWVCWRVAVTRALGRPEQEDPWASLPLSVAQSVSSLEKNERSLSQRRWTESLRTTPKDGLWLPHAHAQQLRALVALAEDLSSVSSTTCRLTTIHRLVVGDLMLLRSLWAAGTNVEHKTHL